MEDSRIFVRQFVDEGLGNSSYLVASTETGLAAVIDPQRDVDRYLQTAEGLGLRLAYALDTHLHADFVSGARELAAMSGKPLMIGAGAGSDLGFDSLPLAEGDVLPLGDLSIGVLSTPGHTPEHISFSLGHAGAVTPDSIFTGGALIVGGAARTDLLGPEHSVPLARRLYRTIHEKLLRYPDEVRIFPTHGGGSFCAAPASPERITSIGRERRTNRLAQARTEEEFVHAALSGLPSYPVYYRYMREFNRKGPRIIGPVPSLEPLSPHRVRQSVENGAVVVDTRTPREFAAGHIPDSYGIPLGSPLITWAGWVVPFGSRVILVADDPVKRGEAVRQLLRIGFDELAGYLDGGIDAWLAAGNTAIRTPVIDVGRLHAMLDAVEPPLVVDVRFDAEWQGGHLPEALHLEPGRIAAGETEGVPRNRPVVIHCAAGYRATVGLSLLERRGYRNLILLDSGFGKWREAGYDIVEEAA